MLNTLRESAHGIFAKILLGLLVVSFGIWGIGDIFRNGGGGSVASVGHSSISAQSYQIALRQKQEELRQMLGNEYKPGLLRQFGIQQQVLGTLINSALIDKESASLGIIVSDEAVAENIRGNPSFQDKDGHFDKSAYQTILRSSNLPETVYIDDLRKELAAKLLTSAITSGVNVPAELVQALYKARGEERIADMLVIPADAIALPNPTEKEIKDYYDAHARVFFAPETRALSYVELKASDIQSKADMSEEDIQRAYDERIGDFHHPERRTLEQMLFAREADAKAAAVKLAHGATFADVAQGSTILNKGKLALGTLTRQETPREAADAVFALKEGESTGPIESSFGWHIFQVAKIEPESTAPLAEVKPEIVKDLAAKGAQDTLGKLANTLEDALAGGSTLENAAEKIGQKVQSVGPVTSEGLTPDGKKAALPADAGFLTAAFNTPEKEHSAALQANDGSYFLVRVDSIAPEHVRPLAQVKDEAQKMWKAETGALQLKKMSHEIAADLRRGKKREDVLAAHHLALQTVSSGPLKRGSQKATEGPLKGKSLPHDLVAALFALKMHETTEAYGTQDGSVLIATLARITPAPQADAKALGAIQSELKEQLADEMMRDYLQYLTKKYGVSINQAAISVKDEEGGE